MSLVGKARARPDQVKKVLDTVQQQGALTAYKKAMSRLDSYSPLGYSLAGVVEEVGEGAEQFSPGQLVACAGNEYALHAEVNWVPTNLCVALPDGVSPQLAAFATVGAIALQGVRQGDVQIGDTACVIGLGLVGQLVVQLLVASGALVVGLDLDQDRCRARREGRRSALRGPRRRWSRRGRASAVEGIRWPWCGPGVLGGRRLLQPAGGAGSTLARDRATVVDIGKCKLDLPWNDYYEKELDFRFSRSYGPGRYDPRYEVDGVDYPPGYVRWTERRNLEYFVNTIARKEVDPEPLIAGIFPLRDAPSVYEQLSTGVFRGVGFLFEYDPPPEAPVEGPIHVGSGVAVPSTRPPGVLSTRPTPVRPTGARSGTLRIGFIGAGNYASSMLLPHLVHEPGVELTQVATRRSLSAVNVQRKFGFHGTSTDPDTVFGDDSIDAVFIVTRHSTHANMTCRALEAGKAVFVEKPLALTADELDRILATVDATGNDRLMVGFNRRFAPLLTDMRSRFGRSSEPTTARYLVNAGRLASDSWYRDVELEGSRFVGEGGHFVDTMSWWIGSDPIEVLALPAGRPEEVQVSLRYDDGSLATITYLTNAHRRFPKETFEASSAGRSARLDNFKRATVWKGARATPDAVWAPQTRANRQRSRPSSHRCEAEAQCRFRSTR